MKFLVARRSAHHDSPRLLSGIDIAVALLAAGASVRLILGRKRAERLSEMNTRLYRGQREISETLQHALLPKSLPEIPGVKLVGSYVPGVSGIEVGGDWYGAIKVDECRFTFHIGDVSGRGLPAVALMASLRYTFRALSSLGLGPSEVLAQATNVIDFANDGHFATALVGTLDLSKRTLTIATAGHPPPLLVHDRSASYLSLPAGAPLGIGRTDYRDAMFSLPPYCTLLLFTDGLIERRGESINEGLERLRLAACARFASIDALVNGILGELSSDGTDDDIAVLAIQWTT